VQRKRILHIRVAPKLLERVRQYCEEEEMTVTQFVECALRTELVLREKDNTNA